MQGQVLHPKTRPTGTRIGDVGHVGHFDVSCYYTMSISLPLVFIKYFSFGTRVPYLSRFGLWRRILDQAVDKKLGNASFDDIEGKFRKVWNLQKPNQVPKTQKRENLWFIIINGATWSCFVDVNGDSDGEGEEPLALVA